MRQVLMMMSVWLSADGLLIAVTGQTIAGDRAPHHVANGLGLIAVGAVSGALYLWLERRSKS